LRGDFVDIFGRHPEYHDPDDATYPAAQAFGQRVRAEPSRAGISYESVRHPGGRNWVCFRPRLVRNVMQSGHLKIDVPKSGRVIVHDLSAV
ncbi:MAG: RES family NAD+ phosphorylase, partial [Roseibium sp.]|uniref:RES family NAD+ phosphorylase n=1 Tax=Roseibium sp. TaxID=1936156 RepID=UPI003297F9C2